MNSSQIARYLVWSTDTLDVTDPFQRIWYLRQVLLHGRAADIHALDIAEIAQHLDALQLPPAIDQLWRKFLEARNATI